MPRIVREADVTWEGTVARGAGVVTGASSGVRTADDDRLARRRPRGEDEPRGAARGGARPASSPRSAASSRARTPPERLEVHCRIVGRGRGDRAPDRRIRDLSAASSRADGAGFAQAVEEADAGCTFSALIRASATVTVEATLEEGEN